MLTILTSSDEHGKARLDGAAFLYIVKAKSSHKALKEADRYGKLETTLGKGSIERLAWALAPGDFSRTCPLMFTRFSLTNSMCFLQRNEGSTTSYFTVEQVQRLPMDVTNLIFYFSGNLRTCSGSTANPSI